MLFGALTIGYFTLLFAFDAEGLCETDFLPRHNRLLGEGGVMVQQSESSLYHAGNTVYELCEDKHNAGFISVATLAGKGSDVVGFREADADATRLVMDHYGAGIHRDALALPLYYATRMAGPMEVRPKFYVSQAFISSD